MEKDVDEDAEETSDYEYTYDGGEDDNEEDGNAEETDEKEYSEENTIGFRYEGGSLQNVIGGSIAMHNILVECKRIASIQFCSGQTVDGRDTVGHTFINDKYGYLIKEEALARADELQRRNIRQALIFVELCLYLGPIIQIGID